MFHALIPVALLGFSLTAEAQPPEVSRATLDVEAELGLLSNAWFRTPLRPTTKADESRGASPAATRGRTASSRDEDAEEEKVQEVERSRRGNAGARGQTGGTRARNAGARANSGRNAGSAPRSTSPPARGTNDRSTPRAGSGGRDPSAPPASRPNTRPSPPASDRSSAPRDGAARPGARPGGGTSPADRARPTDRNTHPSERNTGRNDRTTRPGGPAGERPRPGADRNTRPNTRPKGGATRPGGPAGERPRPGTDRNPRPNTRPKDGATRPGDRTTRPVPGTTRPGGPNVRPGGPNTRPGARPGGRSDLTGFRNVRPYHGVFVYGPRPETHSNYANSAGPVQVPQADLPKRSLDRKGSFAVGIKAGNLYSGYVDGDRYTDFGAGVAARYRPAENVGIEAALQHHDESWNSASTRGQTVASGSFELFAFAWTPFSPYLLAGLTYTSRGAVEQVQGLEMTTKPLIGPHAGVGLELALGKTLAIDVEGRYIGYINRLEDEIARPGAFTLTGGLMFHF